MDSRSEHLAGQGVNSFVVLIISFCCHLAMENGVAFGMGCGIIWHWVGYIYTYICVYKERIYRERDICIVGTSSGNACHVHIMTDFELSG